MRVCIYARVSTDDKEQDPDRQVMKCQQYAELHSHDVIGTFREHISGDTPPLTRKAFTQLMGLQPEGILVFNINRLSRQHPTKVMLLLNQFKDASIKVISVTEPIFNMESPMAEPMQYILTWFNNYYLLQLKKDIKSGMEKAKRDGKIIGRPKNNFNQYRAYQLLFIEKKTFSEVSQEMNVPRATLFRFKKVVQKNPNLFIKESDVSKPHGFGTEEEAKL